MTVIDARKFQLVCSVNKNPSEVQTIDTQTAWSLNTHIIYIPQGISLKKGSLDTPQGNFKPNGWAVFKLPENSEMNIDNKVFLRNPAKGWNDQANNHIWLEGTYGVAELSRELVTDSGEVLPKGTRVIFDLRAKDKIQLQTGAYFNSPDSKRYSVSK